MPTTRSLEVDVTDAAGLPGPLHVSVTVTLPLPSAVLDPPVVCFGYPGGGYSRGYYTFDMPGSHAQLRRHAATAVATDRVLRHWRRRVEGLHNVMGDERLALTSRHC